MNNLGKALAHHGLSLATLGSNAEAVILFGSRALVWPL